MRRLVFWYLTACFLIGLSACGTKKVAELDPDIGQPGDTVLVGNYHNLAAFACKDLGMFSSSDMPGLKEMQDMEAKGAGYSVPDGTKAKVIEIHKKDRDGRLIEFLEGKYQGKTGYISYKCLAKP